MLRPSLPLPMSPRKRADVTSTYLRLAALALFLLAVAADDILEIDRPTVVVIAHPALRVGHQHAVIPLFSANTILRPR